MDTFSLPDQKTFAFNIARPGWPLIGALAFFAALFALFGLGWAAAAFSGAALFVCFFFRDPQRPVPSGEKALVSPADGRVIFAGTADGKHFYPGECVKISVFMSVFNVHVNRIPESGKVKKIWYFPGRFFSANLDKASEQNEHNAIFLETDRGHAICVVQIAGLIARRILCDISGGDSVKRGERLGMICFGSRVDLYLPPDFTLSVKKGDRVKAASSIMGYLE
ncbi:Phosphatidylserine decarboxylase proenzyme [Candidatus Desulfarcum epimagneticum]|uniref:Phosphatidylserine decarboxylase proenzyme n=1 Tax=uncultured Desulfobacteraceae bacterium TaxID=218296 RepID=A0A484HJJ1_9BACT|nr:Phosphatidylserine decarboxylase proenzyme [uncultured Desulfobacteraceae bacterium]